MKKILLLGGFGFIGTNLLKYIDDYYANYYSVVLCDKLPIHPYGMSFNCVKKVYVGDFSNSLFLKSMFEQHKFDLIIHLISTTVPAKSDNSRFDIETNLIPTIELLELMVVYNINDIIFVSKNSIFIYGKRAGNSGIVYNRFRSSFGLHINLKTQFWVTRLISQ